jgi:nucleoporin NUP82
MLAVYETIDLGLISSLDQPPRRPPVLDLLQGNYPSLLVDPIRDDTVYVYHAFGVHALHLGSMFQSLYMALREDEHRNSLDAALANSCGTDVQPILDTFSVTRRSLSDLPRDYSLLIPLAFQVL